LHSYTFTVVNHQFHDPFDFEGTVSPFDTKSDALKGIFIFTSSIILIQHSDRTLDGISTGLTI